MIETWLRAYLFTHMVEMGIYVHAVPDRPWRERIAVAFGASAFTHPIVIFVITDYVPRLLDSGDYLRDWWIGVAVAETFAVTAEAAWLMLYGLRPHHALAWAFCANAWSFTLGLFCYTRLAW